MTFPAGHNSQTSWYHPVSPRQTSWQVLRPQNEKPTTSPLPQSPNTQMSIHNMHHNTISNSVYQPLDTSFEIERDPQVEYAKSPSGDQTCTELTRVAGP